MDTYLARMNYKNNDVFDDIAINHQYENNIISIRIEKHEEHHKDYFDNYKTNGKPKEKGEKYINDFFMLKSAIEIGDVLIIAKYPGHDSKIGIIKRGTQFDELAPDKSGIIYYQYYLTNVKDFNNSENTILLSALPPHGTISHIIQAKEHVNSRYTGEKLSLTLNNLLPNLTELICLEWLRSDCCNNEWRIKYQLLLVGGNNPNIDIYGETISGKVISCQVTKAAEKNKIIQEKKEKLKRVKSDIMILFCNAENKKTDGGIIIIPLQKVWNDLERNSNYKKMLEKLIWQ